MREDIISIFLPDSLTEQNNRRIPCSNKRTSNFRERSISPIAGAWGDDKIFHDWKEKLQGKLVEISIKYDGENTTLMLMAVDMPVLSTQRITGAVMI